jgi:hypothetical protein
MSGIPKDIIDARRKKYHAHLVRESEDTARELQAAFDAEMERMRQLQLADDEDFARRIMCASRPVEPADDMHVPTPMSSGIDRLIDPPIAPSDCANCARREHMQVWFACCNCEGIIIKTLISALSEPDHSCPACHAKNDNVTTVACLDESCLAPIAIRP